MKVVRLATLGLLCALLGGVGAPAMGAIAPLPHDPSFTLAVYGDLPTSGPRRRTRRGQAKEKDKPTAPLATDPQGETPEQHKAYLKRYGF